ncbi:MAG: hypothetical protein ABIH23_32180 [bacterium]
MTTTSSGEEYRWDGPVPELADVFGSIPDQFQTYEVILEPDENKAEWWAGAPSVVRGPDGVFWLACRMRTADAPRGLRGYEIRILRSEDGIHFEKVHRIPREDVPISGFERPALLIDPRTGLFKLYGCGPWQEGPWAIIKFDDAETPTQFTPNSAKPVIQHQPKSYPRDIIVSEYKDPFIIHTAGAYHCYVIGLIRQTERVFHFQSTDGEEWVPVGSPYEPIMNLTGWHDFYVRPASVLPVGVGYLFAYEGSNVKWHDPVYNIGTGLAFTFDLHRIIDLTPESPLVISTTPSNLFSTCRYSHWIYVQDEIWIYAEAARPNRSNEIRLFRLKRSL